MRTVLLSCVFVSLHVQSPAADWPQWRGPNRDCYIGEETVWPESLNEENLTRSWRVPLGPGYSGPIVFGSRVFVTETRDESHEVVRALDRTTGEELWKTEWPGAIKVPFFASANGSWIRSTPATDGERLYVAGIRDVLVCLDVESGNELWRLDFAKEFKTDLPSFGTVCSPLIDGEDLYLQAAASVAKLRKRDGKVLWRSKPAAAGLLGSGMQSSAFSSPVISTIAGKRQLTVQSRKALLGLNLETGEQLWSIDVPAFRGMNILTPLVANDTVFTSTYGGGTFLFNVASGNGALAATEQWKTSQQGYMSSPVMIGDNVYLHLRNQRFTCVNPQNGKSRWTTKPFGKYWSMAVNGTRILALDQTGELRLIDADSEAYQEIDARKLSSDETWAHLAVSDNQIFVRELNAMTAWSWK